VQACCDHAVLRRAATLSVFATLAANLPCNEKPFTTADIITGDWESFVRDNNYEKYTLQFTHMPVGPREGSQETWYAWFADFGWTGACTVLSKRTDISPSMCLQLLRHRLGDGSVPNLVEFQIANADMMPWLQSVSMQCDARLSARPYRAHFQYMASKKRMNVWSCYRGKKDHAEEDLALLSTAQSFIHLTQLLGDLCVCGGQVVNRAGKKAKVPKYCAVIRDDRRHLLAEGPERENFAQAEDDLREMRDCRRKTQLTAILTSRREVPNELPLHAFDEVGTSVHLFAFVYMSLYSYRFLDFFIASYCVLHLLQSCLCISKDPYL